ncbi:MAG: hypothetical protein AAGK97_12045, partial [Bacteroidota bacterium]
FHKMAYSICSDNEILLKAFFEKWDIDLFHDEDGIIALMRTWKHLVLGDMESIKNSILFLKHHTNLTTSIYDAEVFIPIFTGFATKDSGALLYGIETMLANDYRKKIERIYEEEKIKPFIAIAYLKLAQKFNILKDVEGPLGGFLDLNDQFVQYQPNQNFTVPFSYLNEFFIKEGMNFEYDPFENNS